MACAWSAPSHYLNQCWNIVNWILRNKLQWNFNRNSNIFIQENALENVVCEMASILSRPQCVNPSHESKVLWLLCWDSKLWFSPNQTIIFLFRIRNPLQYVSRETVWYVNSLWSREAIWQHGTMSILAQVMAWCLMAPSHYLNQCWLIISEVQW